MSRQDTQLFPEEIPAGAGAARLRRVLFEMERSAQPVARTSETARPRVKRLATSSA